MQRLLHAGFTTQAFPHRAAAVIFTVCNFRPAVVGAGLGEVDFVAALRPVFTHPKRTVGRQCSTLGISMAVTPDFRQGASLADKRVVRRNRAVFIDPHNLAMMVIELLRILLSRKTIAQRQE